LSSADLVGEDVRMDAPDIALTIAAQDLFARYAHRIDRRDFDGFAELFTEDAQFAMGPDECTGPDAIHQFMSARMTSPGGAHVIVNVSVRSASPERATALADYVLIRRTEEAGPWAIVGAGYYESELARVDGDWRFGSHRIVPR
jgi:SnoaL-like domain